MPHCIVFDIGGTTLRAGVVAPSGRLIAPPLRFETPNVWNHPRASLVRVQQRLVETIIAVVRQLQRRYPSLQLRQVGIAMAGPITAQGVVRHASGLWGSGGCNFPLAARLRRRLALRWRVVNDMTAAAAYYGSLPRFRRYRWIAVITVSSGVGSKVFDTQRGEVLLDPAGVSGELGHVRIDDSPTALRCECGTRGHVQGLCSGRAAERIARATARANHRQFQRSRLWRMTGGNAARITTFHLASAIRAHDGVAQGILDRVTTPLAQAIAVLVGTVGIERVVLIGGFALGVGTPYLRAIQQHLMRLGCYGRAPSQIKALVCLGEPGDVHGLIGAGLMVQRSQGAR